MRISDWSSDVCSSDLRSHAELADLRGADVNIIRAGKIVRLRAAKKTEAVRQNFDRSGTHDLLATFSHGFQDGEHQVLFAERRRALDTKLFSHGDKFGRRFPL